MTGNKMNPSELFETNRKEFWIRDSSEPNTARKVIETVTRESYEGQGQFITIITCKSCSRVLHTIEEVKALCGVCKEPLCEDHAKRICSICGRSVCIDDSSRTFSGNFVCITHGFWERLLAQTPRRER
jgi:hypothetical protein